jgi:hypothetical protein
LEPHLAQVPTGGEIQAEYFIAGINGRNKNA